MAFLRSMCVALVVAAGGTVYGTTSAQAASGTPPVNPNLPTVFLVGNADQGAGTELQTLFDLSKINVVDRSAVASGVRSTSDNGSWTATLAMVRSGDFVLIQFARASATGGETESLPGVSDDARRVPAPANSPGDQVLQSYGWYLRRYAVDVIARGGTPILCAPVVADPTEQSRDREWTMAIAVQQRLPFVDTIAAAAAGGTSISNDALSLVAGLKGLPSNPLSGYFSGQGKAVPAYRPPPAPASAPLTAPPS